MFSQLRTMLRQRGARERIYTDPAYWDSKAASYSATAVSGWPNQTLNSLYEAEQRAAVAPYLGDISGLEVLDLGCGTGRFSRWLADRGAKVTGVDFSAATLTIAQDLSPGVNPTYRQESVFDLAEQARYDLIFVFGVLAVACRDRPQLGKALSQIRRALKPGGRVLVTEPIHRGPLHRVLDLGRAEFLQTMQASGFEVRAYSPLHFWPARLLLAYVQWPNWITTPVYHLGQTAMRLRWLSRLGDYWLIEGLPVPVPPAPKTRRTDTDG